MFSEPRTVAFVEDDDDLRIATVQCLQLAGLEVQAFSSGAKALSVIDADFPGVVVTDIRMPQMDGRRLFSRIQAIDPDIPVILITGHGDVSEAVEAMHKGAYDFVAKPFTNDRLIRPVMNALEKRRLVLDNRRLRLAAEGAQAAWPLIGDSPVMVQLRHVLSELARADADTLILGETGVGKELAAHALHAWGPRRGQEFVTVNCAALPAALAESELFGHELGAFPGAMRKRVGRIEHADRGTLFLDELQAMPPEAQVKLLRFLEEREITPLGTNFSRTVNVRVLATLKSSDAPYGGLLPELYHRLDVARVIVPPLRERRSDIPVLFAHFLSQASRRFGRDPPAISDAVRRKLSDHDWTGNVRELSHFAERVLLGLDAVDPLAGAQQGGLKDRVDRIEADLIREALSENQGDIRATTKALGLPRKTLYDKLARHQIDLSHFRPRSRRNASN